MIIKDKFSLLKNTSNVLYLSSSAIKRYSIQSGSKKLYLTLAMFANRVNHFTKQEIIKTISNKNFKNNLEVIILPEYPLHVSYNEPTKQMIINLNPFGIDDIYPNDPDPRNLYALMVYSIAFRNLIIQKIKIKKEYISIIVNYLLSVFIRLFGKEYGLLGTYSSEIVKLKFLIGCYIYSAFFGITGLPCYRMSGTLSMFDFKELQSDLNKYDFTKIEEFIKSLSDFGVMPGINKYSFTHKVLKFMGISFLPALEDLSRFISIMVTSNCVGSNIVSTFISSYNESEFKKLIELSKLIFK